ncbi:MAG: winged helix-turn-helix domain-containing protein [Gammaproteobacteria bacterium]|nr:winged helix-turn-helix domain-containing protein [Gammaproteobacteria bacterium]
MDGSPNIARIGSLIGDNTRAHMLGALMHGKALTAAELSNEAGVTAQTASTHLAKLQSGGLLSVRKQGRHKYFALANEEVAALLETLMGLSERSAPLKTHTGPRDTALRHSRVCYNHLAGNMGIHLYDSLISTRCLVHKDGELNLTKKGEIAMQEFGVDLDNLRLGKSPLCRECLDWSERRSHLAGSLGRALLSRFETLRWVRRDSHSRIIKFSARGERAFKEAFP